MKNFIQSTALEYGDGVTGGVPGAARAALPGHVRPGRADRATRARGAVRAPERAVFQASAATTPSPSSRSTATGRWNTAPAARAQADEAHRQLLRGLRAGRVHDAPRLPRPAALRPPGRALAQRRLRAARGRRGDPGLDRGDVRGLRLRLHPGARPRDGRAGPRRLPRARRDLLRRREPALGHRAGLGPDSGCGCTPTRGRPTDGSS